MIWKQQFTLEDLNKEPIPTMVEHLGIEFIEIGDDYLKAKMPVDHRTRQPYGLLHGGASCVLAETIGSVAATMCIEDLNKRIAVGLQINANHLSSATSGYVIGTAKPFKIGRRNSVWGIEIRTEDGKMICVSRLTMAIIDRR